MSGQIFNEKYLQHETTSFRILGPFFLFFLSSLFTPLSTKQKSADLHIIAFVLHSRLLLYPPPPPPPSFFFLGGKIFFFSPRKHHQINQSTIYDIFLHNLYFPFSYLLPFPSPPKKH